MDSENVIKGIELCEIGSNDRCYETECPYYGQGCTEDLKNDILELLKEQRHEYEKGFNDAMQGKLELMYEGIDGKWHKKDW